MQHALILGGGVAGIAAAVCLATAAPPGRSRRVTLLEMRPRLGGRAGSVPDPDDPTGVAQLDNCQHVVMGCCTAVLELYESLGVADRIDWHDRFDFVHVDGTRDRLRARRLPAPLHFAPSFLGLRGLGWRDKLAITAALRPVRRFTDEQLRAYNGTGFDAWLACHHQTPRAVERFWEPTIVSACNETPDRVAAGYALKVLRDGFLSGRADSRMGLPTVPLAELYGRTAAVLAECGGLLRLGTTVKRIHYDAASCRVTGVTLNDGARLDADAVVSALPFDVLQRLAGPAMIADDARLQRLAELRTSPIIGLHLWVRLPPGAAAAVPPHVVLTGSPMHWFFDRGPSPIRAGARHLHGVVSAARGLIDTPNRELLDLAMGELRRVMPGCADAVLIDGRVIKERRATFSVRPGVDALRPATTGTIGNLLLAGDWCDTGWPATMEGAARSGYAAALACA